MTKSELPGQSLPRVFVSSVIQGFGEYREAARRGIKEAGGEPVLVNEDFPSLDTSPRNACLDAVDSTDIYLGIIGERGGWQTPSGRLVIEEEYDQARARKLPILMFLQDIERDSSAQRFADEVSDYLHGSFRITFRTADELEAAVGQALKPHISAANRPLVDKAMMMHEFQSSHTNQGQTGLRFLLSPERQEEILDPVTLGSDDFKKQIYALGHSGERALFSYQKPKEGRVEGDSLVIHQEDQYRPGDPIEDVRVQIRESGKIIVDSNVTGRVLRGDQHGLLSMYVIAEEDVEDALRADFQFAAAIFDKFDPYKRHRRFVYNVALIDVDNRRLERNPQDRSSYSIRLTPLKEPLIAFGSPRVVERSDLSNPTTELTRILAVFRRDIER